jgi:predicted O-linked N-acetylglucosamine transferase (SPINDLY family)
VQTTYLGYIGSVPIPELDYMLCDDYVVPNEFASQYRPKPLYIGPIYQANVSHNEIGRATFRADVGLPEKAFVFCNFSNHYKVTEEIFCAWMEILSRLPGSILWLAEDNQWSRNNMHAKAEACGISKGRLIFTKRVEPAFYMARFALADVYLDTFPYNSGTVASDALRMSLPLLTLRGEAFASRMAARLLKAMGADLGIAESLRGYIETAILLATRPAIYSHYKSLFSEQSWRKQIGNIESFTKGLEDALSKIKRVPGNML